MRIVVDKRGTYLFTRPQWENVDHTALKPNPRLPPMRNRMIPSDHRPLIVSKGEEHDDHKSNSIDSFEFHNCYTQSLFIIKICSHIYETSI